MVSELLLRMRLTFDYINEVIDVYEIIRGLLLLGVVLVLLLLIKKFSFARKKAIVVTLIVAFVLGVGCDVLPVENAFVSFSSSQQLERYRNTFQPAPTAIIEGENSVWILRLDGPTLSDSYQKRVDGRYKIANPLRLPKRCSIYEKDFTVEVKNYEGDHYVSIRSDTVAEMVVSDNRGTIFQRVTSTYERQKEQRMAVLYVAFVPDLDENYRITVNGMEYILEQ